MKNKKKHLQKEERFLIEKMLKTNKSFGYIAELLERGISTISLEVSRNGGRNAYTSSLAQDRALKSQSYKKLELNKIIINIKIRKVVDKLLKEGNSAESISFLLSKKSRSMYASPKSIRKYMKQLGLRPNLNIDKH